MSKRDFTYGEHAGGERTVFGIAISVQAPGDPPDANDLWRLEQEIEEHVAAIFGEGCIVGAAISVSSPDFGDAPEWLLETATRGSVRKFKAARSGAPVRTHDDDLDWD